MNGQTPFPNPRGSFQAAGHASGRSCAAATRARRYRRALAIALGLAVFAGPAAAVTLNSSSDNGRDTIVGRASVIDGDTLEIDGRRIRLEGIDAPETGQSCKTATGRNWPCGRDAAQHLADYVSGATIECRSLGRDKYERTLANCMRGPIDINAAMVRDGMAWAFVKYSQAFVAEESAARSRTIGVWQGEAIAPWDYRSGAWRVAESRAPEGCAIKGNISRGQYIYHMPWSPWYAKVSIDEGRGERWFCNEAEASAAGWRPVHSGS